MRLSLITKLKLLNSNISSQNPRLKFSTKSNGSYSSTTTKSKSLLDFALLKPSRRNKFLPFSSVQLSSYSSSPWPEFSQYETHAELYQFSLDNPERFWGTMAKSKLRWQQLFDKVQQCDMEKGQFSWFSNGSLNISGK